MSVGPAPDPGAPSSAPGGPIFLHSLFRAGSTYMFEVFRRAPEGYHCFQEPMHEAAWLARDDPALLLANDDEATRVLLRHPPMSAAYFQELHDAWPAWRHALKEEHVYGGYFAQPGADGGQAFWQALAQASPGRPVFQDCRSTGRMLALKQALGGVHLYLWRNPWDQWTSYQVAPYFDATSQFFMLAPGAPGVLRELRERWHIEAPPTTDIAQGFAHFAQHPLTAAASYQTFYALWCLGLRTGWRHADLLLGIDELSQSAASRSRVLARLARLGVTGLDLSDCQVPRRTHTSRDQAFFSEHQQTVHEGLLRDGWSAQELRQLARLRESCEPGTSTGWVQRWRRWLGQD